MRSPFASLLCTSTIAPGSPCPYSTDVGPRSTAMLSIMYGSTRQLDRLIVFGTCSPSTNTVGVKPRSAAYQSERLSDP
ncbi:hypothetical protein NCM_04124 [Burkholderia pseudomallei]